MFFHRVPSELRALAQWVSWRYETFEFVPKPTKVPYSPLTGFRASIIDATHWTTFETCVEAVNLKQYNGIGFVLTDNDKYAFIDLDDAQGNPEILKRQNLIHDQFDTYSERSPSGQGLHLIIEASIPQGRKRGNIEIYSSKRFMTVTGDVYNNKPIARRQELATFLYDEMSFSRGVPINFEGEPERDSDDNILLQGANAPLNGDRFKALYEGRWKDCGYPSQSEADFAFIDMLANYTKNKDQIRRIFWNSWLGVRPKAHRMDYLNTMVDRSFDRVLGPVDLSKFDKDKFKEKAPTFIGARDTEASQEEIQGGASVAPKPNSVERPPGLMGEIADFIYGQSYRPVPEIALCAAIALVAGIVGRQYNTPTHAGLNLYTVLIAQTAVGKEAMASGISKLVTAVKKHVPAIDQFMGPAELASGQGLLRRLEQQNCCLSIMTEFGHLIQNMCSERAPPHLVTLRRVLLDVYTKSGRTNVIRPMVYSDKDKDILDIHEPAFSILAESTPSTFYENLNKSLISMGLIARLFIIEYRGDRVASNKNLQTAPSEVLISHLGALASYCLTNQKNNVTIDVQWSVDGFTLSETFDLYCDEKVCSDQDNTIRDLYGRAHLTVMKLASLFAVSENSYHPTISAYNWNMAQDLVNRAIENTVWNYVNDKWGTPTTEPEQLEMIRKETGKYIEKFIQGRQESVGYGISQLMIEHAIVPFAYYNSKLARKAAFNDGMPKGSKALREALKTICDIGLLTEVEKVARPKYGSAKLMYAVNRELWK